MAGALSCRTLSTTSRCCSSAASVTADVTVVAMPRSRYAMRVSTLPTAAMFESRERDGHAMHLLDPLEPIHALDGEPAGRRCRHDDPRFADAALEDRDQRLTLARGEAGTERQRLHHERACDDDVAARRGPPAGLLDLRRVDVGEGVRGHEAIALEERARALRRGSIFEADLGKQRGRGHRSSFLVERTKRASAG